MKKQYMFVWNFLGSPITAYLSMGMISWLVGCHDIRNVRIWDFDSATYPVERRLLINPTTHCVALQNTETGAIIDQAPYPVPCS